MNLIFLILMHLIPAMMILTICLSLICLTILLHGPHRAVMTLVSVWLGWKLSSKGARASWLRKGLASPLR
jgi:hypothetical protein